MSQESSSRVTNEMWMSQIIHFILSPRSICEIMHKAG